MAYDALIDSTKYIAQMTAIADVIRAATGTTDPIDLDDMPHMIAELSKTVVTVEAFHVYNAEDPEVNGTYTLVEE